MSKIIFLTADSLAGTLATNMVCNEDIEVTQVYIIAHVRGTVLDKIRRAIRLLLRKSILFCAYKFFIEGIFFRFFCVNNVEICSVQTCCQKRGIPYTYISNVDDPQFVAELTQKAKACDVVLSAYGSQLFNSEVVRNLAIFWNIHGGYLPYFRGVAPYFWMLLSDSHTRGVSVHLVADDVDAGECLALREVAPVPGESLFLYHARCVVVAVRLFFDCLETKRETVSESVAADRDSYPARGIPERACVRDFKEKGYSFFHLSDRACIRHLISS